jgi:glyoxylase-like metal-dependent hydrolase (beta-lactamase superfamily II)
MKSDGTDVIHALEVLRLPVSAVRHLFITHWHNDHAAGAGAIKAATGAVVHCGSPEARYLRRETASSGLVGALSDAIPEVGPLVLAKGLLGSAPMRSVEPDVLVGDGDTSGGLYALSTPGHTEGHTAFYDDKERVLFAGDALAFIDGRLRFMSRSVTPDLKTARNSMRRCLDLPFDVVCAGHRAPGRIDANDRRDFEKRIASDDWPIFG